MKGFGGNSTTSPLKANDARLELLGNFNMLLYSWESNRRYLYDAGANSKLRLTRFSLELTADNQVKTPRYRTFIDLGQLYCY